MKFSSIYPFASITEPLCIGKEKENNQQFGRLEANRSQEIRELEDPCGQSLSAELGDHHNAVACCYVAQSGRVSPSEGARLIDDRSILTYKHNLKKFWERKMELDMKLKTEKPQTEDRKSTSKLPTIELGPDENNNLSQETEDLNRENPSDEEWRSLSPNVEPTSGLLFAAGQRKSEAKGDDKWRELQEQPLCLARMPPDESCSSNELTSDESQLMSIDPTICRPRADEVETRTEEQIANEEFSSSSSSFGSASLALVGEQRATKSITQMDAEESDDQTSTQSGSVLTVLANQPASSSTISASDQDTSASQTRDFSASMSLASSAEDPFKSNAYEEDAQQQQVATQCEQLEEIADDEQPASNIGVAFESLHFDTEIKSSKSEPLDQQLLIGGVSQESVELPVESLAPSVRRRPPSARELRSVCNLISAAISDANHQIAACSSQGPSASSVAHDDSVVEPKEEQLVSLQRATFLADSPDVSCPSPRRDNSPRRRNSVDCVTELRAAHQDDEPTAGGQHETESFPKADLSSIFEANVRREIERFETNSMVRKPSSSSNGRLISKSGLTEWRIAEEIRLLKERELELKNRAGSDNSTANRSTGGERIGSNQQAEAIVRFGKTIQLPKSVASSNPQLVTKSIKLSTSVRGKWQLSQMEQQQQQQAASTISMHKFVASKGKRFIFANGSQDRGYDSTVNQCKLRAAAENQLTKSMSNLCTVTSKVVSGDKSHDSSRTQRRADTIYKPAVEGHKGRSSGETDTSVSRRDAASRSNLRNLDAQCPQSKVHRAANGQQLSPAPHHSPPLNHSTSQLSSCSSCSSNSVALSAELKIQEELREMRLREAELRNQRYLSLKQNPAIAHSDHLLLDGSNNHRSVGGDRIGSEPTNECINEPNDNSIDELNYSNESLYPIKQAIDSFRKLNDSTQCVISSHSSVPLPQQNGAMSIHRKFQRPSSQGLVKQDQEQDNCADDYDSKVGKERRKISMIDKWESGQI